ncbi:MAG: DDE-type integrase/transposase/recombinase [Ignavibacteria bacterium]|nr:DDE-type integrase/transposase/recombinase [Ignavibacteria bacterium]MBI3765569.1 DDE-type integrase/transposase/recombinase [Ignavibacteriales bacterium]
MNRLPLEKRTQIIGLLVEGNSLRAAARLSGTSLNTVTKLLVDVGTTCQKYHDQHVKNLKSKRVECDEIWSFCYAKAQNVPQSMQGQYGVGDVWTWTALDSNSKLIISYLIGLRNADCANIFMQDVAGRLTNRIQLTTDGLKAYLEAVEGAFGADVDYAQLVKMYGEAPGGEKRYSPPKCNGTQKQGVMGMPNPKHISTSYVERQNLTMRMNMRRFTRLTNAFSKKIDNHENAIALHFMYYNFVRIHKTLRVTPAQAAGITTKLWEVEDLAKLTEDFSGQNSSLSKSANLND